MVLGQGDHDFIAVPQVVADQGTRDACLLGNAVQRAAIDPVPGNARGERVEDLRPPHVVELGSSHLPSSLAAERQT